MYLELVAEHAKEMSDKIPSLSDRELLEKMYNEILSIRIELAGLEKEIACHKEK